MPPADRATPMQSVDRALYALELLAERGESGVTELSEALGVHRSTGSRLLSALETRRMVEQPDERGRYRLGRGVLFLARAVSAQMDLTQVARPVCEALAEQVGETVNVAIPSEGEVVTVDQVRGSSAVTFGNWTGMRAPAHASSSGKVLLAFGAVPLPSPRSRLQRFTELTITDRRQLVDQLETIGTDGFALSDGELEIGLRAVAAPVRDASGAVVAALSASGPGYRFDEEHQALAVPLLVAAAREISENLGWTHATATATATATADADPVEQT